MKKERVVPKKNYFYLLLMIIGVVIITFIIFGINDKYQNKKLESSYLSGYVNQIRVEEIDNILTEPNSDMFVLITKTGDDNVYNFENALKKIIKKKDLRDNFIFIDYSDNDNYDVINKKFKSNIKSVPAIIYIKNGEFVKNIDSSEHMLNVGDFEKLLDEYEVK